MDYSKLPKVELHLHLDCSSSYEVVQKLNPSITYDEYRASLLHHQNALTLQIILPGR
jgi:adenosine deaminase